MQAALERQYWIRTWWTKMGQRTANLDSSPVPPGDRQSEVNIDTLSLPFTALLFLSSLCGNKEFYTFTPLCIHAIPPHRSVHASPSKSRPVINPASRIIPANSGCGGNLRIDSTRYWYDALSPANIVPRSGIIEKEY
jgi:hypothetical protein